MTFQNPLFDPCFWDGVVTEVSRDGAGWEVVFTYTFCTGLRLWITDEKNIYRIIPKVGDHIRLYGWGYGRPVRGVALNGYTVFWRAHE